MNENTSMMIEERSQVMRTPAKHFENVIDGPTLMDMNRDRKLFCIDKLIPR